MDIVRLVIRKKKERKKETHKQQQKQLNKQWLRAKKNELKQCDIIQQLACSIAIVASFSWSNEMKSLEQIIICKMYSFAVIKFISTEKLINLLVIIKF